MPFETNSRTLDPCPVLVPHSLHTLLCPVSIWRRTSILYHQSTCVPRVGDWAPGIGDQRELEPTSLACKARLQPSEVCVYIPSAEVSAITTRDFEHLNFLFRTLKMEEQKKAKSREQNKKAWEGKGAEGNSCYWQAKQHDSVSFKIVFSLNKVGPSLFQVHPKIW